LVSMPALRTPAAAPTPARRQLRHVQRRRPCSVKDISLRQNRVRLATTSSRPARSTSTVDALRFQISHETQAANGRCEGDGLPDLLDVSTSQRARARGFKTFPLGDRAVSGPAMIGQAHRRHLSHHACPRRTRKLDALRSAGDVYAAPATRSWRKRYVLDLTNEADLRSEQPRRLPS
jgi:hypothetical protein